MSHSIHAKTPRKIIHALNISLFTAGPLFAFSKTIINNGMLVVKIINNTKNKQTVGKVFTKNAYKM